MILLIAFLGINFLLPAYTLEGNEKSADVSLNKVDAIQAMAIANQWMWTGKEVKSYVTPRTSRLWGNRFSCCGDQRDRMCSIFRCLDASRDGNLIAAPVLIDK